MLNTLYPTPGWSWKLQLFKKHQAFKHTSRSIRGEYRLKRLSRGESFWIYNLKAVSCSQWGRWPPFLQFLQSSCLSMQSFSNNKNKNNCSLYLSYIQYHFIFSVSLSESCICVSYRLNLFYLIVATDYVIGCKSSKEVAWLPFGPRPDESLCGWNMLACIFYDSGSLINGRFYILCSSECLRPPPLDQDGAPY